MSLHFADRAWEKPTATGREKQTEPPPVRRVVRVPRVSRVSAVLPISYQKITRCYLQK